MNMNFNVGEVIYKYRLDRKLGQGAFGQVWLATDIIIENQVALKILPSEFRSVIQTLEEARNGHKVNHNNLLKIYSADIVPTSNPDVAIVVIAQEYHKNGTIESRLNSLDFLDLPILLKVLKDVLLGLEYLMVESYIMISNQEIFYWIIIIMGSYQIMEFLAFLLMVVR